MGRSVILPAVMKSLRGAADLVSSSRSVLGNGVSLPEEAYYMGLREHVVALMTELDALDACHEKLDAMADTHERAIAARDCLIPLMAACRTHADTLEIMVDDADWPLPNYNELLWQH